ncbi:MAG: RNA-binding domain-containing protein [Ginsengibacter sp.]
MTFKEKLSKRIYVPLYRNYIRTRKKIILEKELDKLFRWLLAQGECEWVEYKLNFHSPEEIGQDLSALSNGACLKKESRAYLIFGIKEENEKFDIPGTGFKPKSKKIGNEPLENWLVQQLSPKTDFVIHEFEFKESINIVIFEIHPAQNVPLEFQRKSFIRIGSVSRELREFPDKARQIWLNRNLNPFELEIAKNNLTASEVVNLLDTSGYFQMMKLPYPVTQKSVLEKFESDRLVIWDKGSYSITNLGALLFALEFDRFPKISRKKIRVVQFEGRNKLKIIRNQQGMRGYAIGFNGLMTYINGLLPTNEII